MTELFRPVTGLLYLQRTKEYERKTHASLPRAEFKLAIPVFRRTTTTLAYVTGNFSALNMSHIISEMLAQWMEDKRINSPLNMTIYSKARDF